MNNIYSNLPPPRAFVDFVILKKATQALNGHALLFCVYMVKCTDSHIRYLCYIYQYMNLVKIVFYVSVQKRVLALYFLLIMQSKTSKRKESGLGHQWIRQDRLLAQSAIQAIHRSHTFLLDDHSRGINCTLGRLITHLS